jgi:ABC-2 type transport system ATP-binding protein
LNLTLITPDTDRATQALASLGIKATVEKNTLTATIASDLIKPEQIVRQLVELGVNVELFTLLAPTLEEQFVGLTGEGFDVAR